MLLTPTPDSKNIPVSTQIARLFFIDAAAQIAFLPEPGSLIISLASGLIAKWNHPYAMPIIVILGVVRLLWILFLSWLALAFGPLPWSILSITFVQRLMVYVGVLALVFLDPKPLMAWLVAIGVVAVYPLGYMVFVLLTLFGR
jgi:hypothetical protein